MRTSSGWEEAAFDGEPAACPANDPDGGRLCRLASEWWASLGRTPCGQPASVCDGSSGALVSVQTLAPPVVDADLDGDSVWLLRPHELQRWTQREGGSPELAAATPIGPKTRALAARDGRVVVATDGGVLLASATESGVELGTEIPLCGPAVAVVALSGQTWAVMTTVGLVLVGGGADQPLRVLSTSVLSPAWGGEALALSSDAQTSSVCKLAMKLSKVAPVVKAFTALARVTEARLLVGTSSHLFDVDTTNPEAPVVRSALGLSAPVKHLRADARGERAYGVEPGLVHRPVFGLDGNSLEQLGTHVLTSWVTRREAGELRLRVHHQHAELAEVVP